ncbi:GNAT family N-acetyltransferase [Bartonella krasnovii]|nr:GNAT family N-acetyltransferase [Bartonella krasnovii]UNF35748.1 GNAT family N-acetyltransferase [Bartonella krasnovii]
MIARWMDKIAGHIFFDCSDKDKAYLARLYVLPSYQRLGIGEKLLEQAIAINKIQGRIHLKVNSENIKGLSFYEKLGFKRIGQLYEDGRTLLIMEKEI